MPSFDLVCPSCRTALISIADCLRCPSCDVSYPYVGGIACLMPEPARFLHESIAQLALYQEAVRQRACELLEPATRLRFSAKAQARMSRIATGLLAEQRCLDELYTPFFNAASLHLAPAAGRAPSDDPLAATRYSEHLFRDWVWGEQELARTRALLDPLLSQPAPVLAVLGAGTARLALDLANHPRVGEVLAMDMNPLPFLVADRLLHGTPVDLVEFPLVPRSLEHLAIARRLQPPRLPSGNLRLCLADALRSPCTNESVDVVVTPWLIDAIDADIATLTAEISRLLRPGGLWLNVGPLNYSGAPARAYTLEEVFEAAGDSHLSIEVSEEHRLEYFNSPVSGTYRIDRTYVFAARKAVAGEA